MPEKARTLREILVRRVVSGRASRNNIDPAMGSKAPISIASEVHESVGEAVQSLRDAGWHISEIEWEDRTSRTLRFSARKEGQGVYLVCHEKDLLKRLEALL